MPLEASQDFRPRCNPDDGWLTLTGLFVFNEGDNCFGSPPACSKSHEASACDCPHAAFHDGQRDA